MHDIYWTNWIRKCNNQTGQHYLCSLPMLAAIELTALMMRYDIMMIIKFHFILLYVPTTVQYYEYYISCERRLWTSSSCRQSIGWKLGSIICIPFSSITIDWIMNISHVLQSTELCVNLISELNFQRLDVTRYSCCVHICFENETRTTTEHVFFRDWTFCGHFV